MADLSKPMRAVRLTLKLDADDMRDLRTAHLNTPNVGVEPVTPATEER